MSKANLTGSTLVFLFVIGLAIKACGGETATERSSRSSYTAPVQPVAQAYKPTPQPVDPVALHIKKLYVGPQTLNVRTSPNGQVSGSLIHGAAVDVHEERDGWSRVSPSGQRERWVSSAHLCTRQDCSDAPRWRSGPSSPAPSAPARFSSPPASSSYGCPCSSDSNCYGPRGGRYCITSGGNKRYR
ncbi:SH3 domain-containing protein [Verticiella sediminum]